MGRSFRELSSIGRIVGRWVYRLLPIRRWTIVRQNLARCFPGSSPRERRTIARGCYESLGATVFEVLGAARLATLGNEELDALVRVEGREHLDRALAGGRGVLIVTAHLGGFDLVACACARRVPALHVVTTRMRARGLDEFWQRTRAALGVRLHPPRGSMRALLAALRANECVAMMFDQRVLPRDGGVELPFFGHPAGTTLAPAVLSSRTGAPIVPAHCVREADGTHRLVLEPAIAPPRRDRGAHEALALRLTERVEAWVRATPAQWLWLHDRWRRG